MNRIVYATAVLTAAVVLTACSPTGKDQAAAADESRSEPASRVQHDTNGDVIIKLDAATQRVMGLQVASLAAKELAPEVKAFGRVMDPTTLSALVADWVSAQAGAEAAQKDLARLQTLAAQHNASTRALEAAQAEAQRSAAMAAVARAKVQGITCKELAERPDLADFTAGLIAGREVLVRLDLPAGEALAAAPVGARLVSLIEDATPVPAQFAGAAAAMDPQTQGRALWFLATTNLAELPPNSAVTGYVQIPGARQSGVLLPRAAVVRFKGTSWVYVLTGADEFVRRQVALEQPFEGGWFIREGLAVGTKVVTTGAQQLLSEELKGQGGEE